MGRRAAVDGVWGMVFVAAVLYCSGLGLFEWGVC